MEGESESGSGRVYGDGGGAEGLEEGDDYGEDSLNDVRLSFPSCNFLPSPCQ